jgi:uncharacterized alpha-E superfamily protein
VGRSSSSASTRKRTRRRYASFCCSARQSQFSGQLHHNVRENARAIRDRMSREMWENVNGLYYKVRDMQQNTETRNALHGFCREIISGSHALMASRTAHCLTTRVGIFSSRTRA